MGDRKQPLYRIYPDRYAFNKTTQRHVLKSNRPYKDEFAKNPSNFVETRSMYPIMIPFIPVPEPEEKKTVIGAPLHVYTGTVRLTPEEAKKEKENEKMRLNIQQIIKRDLAENPKVYEDKDSAEMTELFRKLLLEKLAKPVEKPKARKRLPVRHTRVAPKPISSSSKFRVCPREPETELDAEVSGLDEYDVEGLEEDEE